MNPKEKALKYINSLIIGNGTIFICTAKILFKKGIDIALKEQTKEIFLKIQSELYNRYNNDFKWNDKATFRRLENIRKEYKVKLK